jgi:hypothetical protein
VDRYDLYELCVQSPRHVVAFLRGLHGESPLVLREDFCGAAAVSRRWCLEGQRRGDASRAVGVDLDAEALDRAGAEARRAGVGDRLALVRADALAPGEGGGGAGAADVIFVGNFSIGYIAERRRLVEYLRRCRARLAAGSAGWGGGVFVCDTYGGSAAFRTGAHRRTHVGRRGEVVHYTWEHVAADPLTGMVENAISFRVEAGGEVVQDLPRAFTYRWRLWGIAELREAMAEAGFGATEVHQRVEVDPGARPEPVRSAVDLGENWIVCVAGRV